MTPGAWGGRTVSARLVAAAGVWVLVMATARADDRAADARRLLDLLTGARLAYLEAFEPGGDELESLTELEEARLLLREAGDLNQRVRLVAPEALAGVAGALDGEIGKPDVSARLAGLAAEAARRSGLPVDERPPEPASAARGGALYRENCAGCHGERGAGDGPDAARAGLTPADFTNVAFMRRETPVDFFGRITLGHRRRGMPEWTALNVQQRWDLVAHVWALQHPAAERRAGAQVWAARCAPCHGERGAGVSGQAGALGGSGALDERTDRTIFVGLFRGAHAGPNQAMTDAERWQAIGHLRSFTIGAGSP